MLPYGLVQCVNKMLCFSLMSFVRIKKNIRDHVVKFVVEMFLLLLCGFSKSVCTLFNLFRKLCKFNYNFGFNTNMVGPKCKIQICFHIFNCVFPPIPDQDMITLSVSVWCVWRCRSVILRNILDRDLLLITFVKECISNLVAVNNTEVHQQSPTQCNLWVVFFVLSYYITSSTKYMLLHNILFSWKPSM